MGWKDIFKSKTPDLQADPRLRWFGKLPTYADYYTSKSDSEWAVEFKDWLLKGYALYFARQKKTDHHAKRLASAHCLLRLPSSGMAAFALLDDYGGDMQGRPFPICFYAGAPSAWIPGPESDSVEIAVSLLVQMSTVRRDIGRFFNAPSRFEEVFGDREVNLTPLEQARSDDSWRKAAAALPFAEWYAATSPAAAGIPTENWCGKFHAMGDSLSRHSQGEEPFEPTLLLPLASGKPALMQAAGWLSWLGARMDLKEQFLSIFLPADLDHGPGSMAIIARPPVPDDFLLLTSLAGSLPYVENLCLEPPASQEKPGEPVAESSPPDQTGPAGSWLDFLTAGHGRSPRAKP